MKFKSLLLSTALGVVLTSATLANTPPSVKATNVLEAFAESHLTTDANKLEKILSADAHMKFTKGSEVLTQGQPAIIRLKKIHIANRGECFLRMYKHSPF